MILVSNLQQWNRLVRPAHPRHQKNSRSWTELENIFWTRQWAWGGHLHIALIPTWLHILRGDSYVRKGILLMKVLIIGQ